LEAGSPFRIGPKQPGDASGATANHPLAGDLRPGDRVLLSDGAAELRVTASTGDTVEAVIERSGTVRSRAGVAVPADRLSLPALTDDDRAVLPRLVEMGVDFVGLSFVRTVGDVESLRDALAALSPDPPAIVAKIETRPAVEVAEGIIRSADAVMVARGDLGVELPFEEVPLIQKRLVEAARAAERPVIIATQMLESMTSAPRPTRAEASDVANAALEGADAVMLSAETAVGSFPIEAADAAVRIVRAAGAGWPPGVAQSRVPPSQNGHGKAVPEDARAVALAAIELARNAPNVQALACFTRTGRTARLLAAQRPRVPIFAFSPDARVRRRLALVHGVVSRPIGPTTDADLRRALADGSAELIEERDAAIVLVATSAGGRSGPNVVEIVGPGER
jgi:pyruvate kinase